MHSGTHPIRLQQDAVPGANYSSIRSRPGIIQGDWIWDRDRPAKHIRRFAFRNDRCVCTAGEEYFALQLRSARGLRQTAEVKDNSRIEDQMLLRVPCRLSKPRTQEIHIHYSEGKPLRQSEVDSTSELNSVGCQAADANSGSRGVRLTPMCQAGKGLGIEGERGPNVRDLRPDHA